MPQALIRLIPKTTLDQLVAAADLPLTLEAHDDVWLLKTSDAPEDWDLRPAMAKALQEIADKDAAELHKKLAKEKAAADLAAEATARETVTLTAADVGTVPAAAVAAQPGRRR